jgi:hypothetical protein
MTLQNPLNLNDIQLNNETFPLANELEEVRNLFVRLAVDVNKEPETETYRRDLRSASAYLQKVAEL